MKFGQRQNKLSGRDRTIELGAQRGILRQTPRRDLSQLLSALAIRRDDVPSAQTCRGRKVVEAESLLLG
jgi:hypothetical protein